MVFIPKQKNNLTQIAAAVLQKHLPPGARVTVALSGGMDSVALCDAVLPLAEKWELSVCHINHGLSRRADFWQHFCTEFCGRLGVPLIVHRAAESQKKSDEKSAADIFPPPIKLDEKNAVGISHSSPIKSGEKNAADISLPPPLAGGGERIRAGGENYVESTAESTSESTVESTAESTAESTSEFALESDKKFTEEWARKVRLDFFSLLKTDAVITAHHADDLAETVLFRLLRGGGVYGMRAMSPCRALPPDKKLIRPWLFVPQSAVADYARRRRLSWVEDEDNRNPSRSRNAIRQTIMPLLKTHFPNADMTAAARRFSDNATLLDELAKMDDKAARESQNELRKKSRAGLQKESPRESQKELSAESQNELENGDGYSAAYFRQCGIGRTRNWLHYRLRGFAAPFSEKQIGEVARQILHGDGNLRADFHTVALSARRGRLLWESTKS